MGEIRVRTGAIRIKIPSFLERLFEALKLWGIHVHCTGEHTSLHLITGDFKEVAHIPRIHTEERNFDSHRTRLLGNQSDFLIVCRDHQRIIVSKLFDFGKLRTEVHVAGFIRFADRNLTALSL